MSRELAVVQNSGFPIQIIQPAPDHVAEADQAQALTDVNRRKMMDPAPCDQAGNRRPTGIAVFDKRRSARSGNWFGGRSGAGWGKPGIFGSCVSTRP
jgi:hypothetical protein